jgi:hypothetical protein
MKRYLVFASGGLLLLALSVFVGAPSAAAANQAADNTQIDDTDAADQLVGEAQKKGKKGFGMKKGFGKGPKGFGMKKKGGFPPGMKGKGKGKGGFPPPGMKKKKGAETEEVALSGCERQAAFATRLEGSGCRSMAAAPRGNRLAAVAEFSRYHTPR